MNNLRWILLLCIIGVMRGQQVEVEKYYYDIKDTVIMKRGIDSVVFIRMEKLGKIDTLVYDSIRGKEEIFYVMKYDNGKRYKYYDKKRELYMEYDTLGKWNIKKHGDTSEYVFRDNCDWWTDSIVIKLKKNRYHVRVLKGLGLWEGQVKLVKRKECINMIPKKIGIWEYLLWCNGIDMMLDFYSEDGKIKHVYSRKYVYLIKKYKYGRKIQVDVFFEREKMFIVSPLLSRESSIIYNIYVIRSRVIQREKVIEIKYNKEIGYSCPF